MTNASIPTCQNITGKGHGPWPNQKQQLASLRLEPTQKKSWNWNIFVSNNSWFLKLKKQPTPRDEEKELFKFKELPMEVDETISSETKSQVLQSI